VISTISIPNPKRKRGGDSQGEWFPYYAGYSREFTLSVLSTSSLRSVDLILDPWNGAGTTTAVSAALGKTCIGLDLNPVMVLVARAQLLAATEKSSLVSLAKDILTEAQGSFGIKEDDPLLEWFVRPAAAHIRGMERAIFRVLISSDADEINFLSNTIGLVSCLACFFYTALFRTVRRFVSVFQTSNPTWIKAPQRRRRLATKSSALDRYFSEQVCLLGEQLIVGANLLGTDRFDAKVALASSTALPQSTGSVRFILASPPYCTRIDYAVVTRPELAVLGVNGDAFDVLRRKLMGTTTVDTITPAVSPEWGPSCLAFIESVRRHRSRASSTYYLKNHIQYFAELFASIREIARVLTKDGACLLVVQDSYYKEIHNNLPVIVSEMSEAAGLALRRRVDFNIQSTLVRVNPRTRTYRTSFRTTESVLCIDRA
jgi:DNA modification methylase